MIANQVAGLLASPFTAPAGDFESIATVTVGSGGTSTITFSSIPSTYKHLQIRALARSSDSSGLDILYGNLNSDTTAGNYAKHIMYGFGSGSAGSYGSANDSGYDGMASNFIGSSIFGAYIIDILDYANTNKYKTVRNLNGYDANGSGRIYFQSNLWKNTAAVSSLTFTTYGGGFTQYSSFALYGVK